MRDADLLVPAAVSGFTFLAVGVTGLAVTVGLAVSAAVGNLAWTLTAPGLLGGALALGSGAAGYVLAREHTRALLEREGLLRELEEEFDRLGGELRRLAVERSGPVSVRPEDVERLERRLADLERTLGKAAAVRVEVSR